MTYKLTPDDLREAERAARRFQGAWYGTSGNLAAWVVLLLNERKQMENEIEAALAERMPGFTFTPAEPAEEVTFEDPEPVSAMPPEQLEAAWAGVRERQRQLQENLRNPQAAEPVERRVVNAGDVESPHRGPESFIGRWAADRARQQEAQQRSDPAAQAEGTTAKFGTGAIRSDTFEEFRYDLVSPIGLREVARACAEGAAKYGDWNWEKGMPVHDLLNHALAHVYQFLAGDRSEPHLGHAAWNLLAAIHSHELWHHLNDGNLRGPDCKAPQCTKVQ